MKSFTEILRLDDPSIDILRSLVGAKLYRIYAGCLQVAGQHYTAPSLSFERGRKDYIGVTCKWFETPYSWADYWQLTVSEEQSPRYVDVSSDGALVAPCVINFYNAGPISSIEIRSTQWEFSNGEVEEHIQYDSALLFHLSDKRRYCIWCELNGPGIATEVHFTEDAELIGEVLERTQPRIRLYQRS